MIEMPHPPDLIALGQRLAEKAGLLAEARAAETLLAARADASRWRRASLLWPLFTKG